MITIPNAPEIKMPKWDNGHWHFPEQMNITRKLGSGFVYVVRDTYMGTFYLGKKSYFGSRGNARGMESNWRHYVSSSKYLRQMFSERPLEEFEFICLEEYQMKGAVSYAETWTACFMEIPTTSRWHNVRIEGISWPVKERITYRHKERLQRVIQMESFEEEI